MYEDCNKNLKFQVFSEASVLFSVGGKVYSSEPLTYTYMEDRIFETSRNVSIKLHRRVGRFIKLRLYFAAKWIMVSEITFDSGNLSCFQVQKYKKRTIKICILKLH